MERIGPDFSRATDQRPSEVFHLLCLSIEQQCAQVAGPGTVFDIATATPTTVEAPSPGWIQIFSNPKADQIQRQPAGTTEFFIGTFDFSDATLLGLPTNGDIAGKVNKSGDAMTGALDLSRDPFDAAEASTKNYVDTQVATRADDTLVVHKTGERRQPAIISTRESRPPRR